MSLYVFNIVEFGCQRVIDVDDDDLPVCLFLVQQSHNAEHFDLLDLACVADKLTDLADVEWVVVAFGFGFGVDYIGIFPCLRKRKVRSRIKPGRSVGYRTYAREGTVVPEVAFVREAVADEAKLAFLDVLLDGVEEFFFGDLH